MARDLGKRAFFTASAPATERFMLRAFAMAAALLGLSLRRNNDFVLTRRVEGKKPVDTCAWFFEPKSAAGEKAVQMWLNWNDPEWIAKNPTNPLAQYRVFAEALEDARKHEEKAVPIAVITRGKKTAFIPVDCSPERKKQLLEMLEK